MKRCLILGLFAASAAAAAVAQGSAPHPQQIATAKPAPSRAGPAAQQSAPVRHLSDQERAELRRQLQQFNQQYIRRP